MDVDAMLEEMTAPQLGEWLAFYRIEPFGEARADLRAGIIAAASVSPWAKRGRRPTPRDFMPDFDAPRGRRQTRDEQIAAAKRMAAYFGAANGQHR